jgi:hypothetical protein
MDESRGLMILATACGKFSSIAQIGEHYNKKNELKTEWFPLLKINSSPH